jgi:hypothetical protein
LEPDPKVQVSALSELGELVGHQSTLYQATAPVAVYVAGILTHPAAMTLRPFRETPVRAALLSWLASTAYDAWGHCIPGPEPLRGEAWDWGPHSGGRGDLEPPF